MEKGYKKIVVGFILLLMLLSMSICHTFADDGDSCWSNCSNIRVSNRNGCNAQAVYQYCTFFVNFWNPNANLHMRSATATFKKNGTIVKENTVWSSDSNHYFNYASIPFYFEEAGVYTLERKITMLDGTASSYDPVSVTLNDVGSCGSVLSVSPQTASLSMTGTKSIVITARVSGVRPDSMTISYSASNSNVSCSWGGWYDTDGDGEHDSDKLTVNGVTGGSTDITISLLQTDSKKVISTKKVSVTIGPNYTVSYNSNGGSGAPGTQTKYYGKTLSLSNTKPTRTGYTFQGWSTSSIATSATYTAGSSYTSNSDVKLYAVWKPYEYTVSYNANGGEGAPAAQTKYYGRTLTLSRTEPTRSGYDFLGWSTSSTANSATYAAGGSYTSNGSVTLYAVWGSNEYTVSYNANGGEGEPASQTKTYNEALTLSNIVPTRTGYMFLGWSVDSDTTVADYQPGGSYTANKGVVLYAVWQPCEYNVSYNARGGEGAPATQTKYHDQELVLSDTEPTRTGYGFRGWSTDSDAAAAEYQPGESYTANEDATFYAVWKLYEYMVFYDVNGGENEPIPQPKYYDEDLIISDMVPTRTGYDFLGWSTDSDAVVAEYQPGGNYTANTDALLYAVWRPHEYMVSYNADGGEGEPASQTKYHDKPLVLSDMEPIRTGYNFLGWSTDSDAVTVEYMPGSSYTMNEAATLYAVWGELNEYTVFYVAFGADSKPQPQTKYHDEPLTLSEMHPTREGYDFLGWATAEGESTVVYLPGDIYEKNENVELFAVWKKQLPEEKPPETEVPETDSGVGGEAGNETGEVMEGTGDTAGGDNVGEGGMPEMVPQQPAMQPDSVIDGIAQTIQVKTKITKPYAKNKKFSLNAKASGKLTYVSGNKRVVTVSKTGKVTIKGFGKTKITVTAAATSNNKKTSVQVNLSIVPPRVVLKSVRAIKKGILSIEWRKSKWADGYEIQYSKDPSFPKKNTVKGSARKTVTSGVTKHLKSGEFYYIRVRALKKVKGAKLKGIWSKVKRVKVK